MSSSLKNALLRLILVWRTQRDDATVVLNYHSIGNKYPQSVAPDQFRRQLQLVQKYFEIVPLREALERSGESSRQLAITFDDGYADNHRNALPVLNDFDVPAMFFVCSHLLGESIETWSGQLPVMNVTQLTELASEGYDVGSHGRSHARMTELEPAELRDELNRSRDRLESITEFPVKDFAYPHGDYDERVVSALRESGYQRACTTECDYVGPDTDPLLIPRLVVIPGVTAGLLTSVTRKNVKLYGHFFQ